MNLLHSPGDVVRGLLVALNYGTDPDSQGIWPMFSEGEADRPDNAVTVYTTTGTEDGRSMISGAIYSHFGIQVRVRSSQHAEGWVKTNSIRTGLSGIVQRLVSKEGSRYVVGCFSGIGQVLPLGKEAPTSKRSLFTLNAKVVLRQI